MRSKVERRASMAGWLFADLSIVLAIIFIGSTLSQNDNETTPAPSTTIAPENDLGNTLNVDPIKLKVTILNPSNASEVQRRLELALKTKGLDSTTKFGVVIIHGGTGGPLDPQLVNDAKDRANEVAESLSSWSRLTPKRWVSGEQAIGSPSEQEYQFTLLIDLTTDVD